jgi:hypothetical protein
MARAISILNVVTADSTALDCGGSGSANLFPARKVSTGFLSATPSPPGHHRPL